MTRITICLVFASLIFGCDRKSQSTDQIQTLSEQREIVFASLIGKTVGEAREQLKLKLDYVHIVDEPPGICRAIEFCEDEDEKEDQVWLYVSREDAVVAPLGRASVNEFENLKVAGIAIRHEGKWETAGDVIAYYHINTR